jgi:HEAT repeat protein
LRELLGKSDPILEYHAAIALGKIGDKSDATVDALVAAIGSNDMRVSRAALSAIKNLQPGPKKTVPALKKALQSGDPTVAAHALEAIVEQGANAVPFINEALMQPETAYIAAAAAEQIGADAAGAVPALTELLKKTNHSQLDVRVLLALGRIGAAAKPAVPTIIEHLNASGDRTVPVAAAFALGLIGDPAGDAALKAAAAKPDRPFLNMVAAFSLAKLHPEDAAMKAACMGQLKAGIESTDPDLKAAAEKGMKMMEMENAAPAAATK